MFLCIVFVTNCVDDWSKQTSKQPSCLIIRIPQQTTETTLPFGRTWLSLFFFGRCELFLLLLFFPTTKPTTSDPSRYSLFGGSKVLVDTTLLFLSLSLSLHNNNNKPRSSRNESPPKKKKKKKGCIRQQGVVPLMTRQEQQEQWWLWFLFLLDFFVTHSQQAQAQPQHQHSRLLRDYRMDWNFLL